MTSEYKTHQGRIKWKPGRAIHYAALAFRNPSLIKKRKYIFIISHMRSYSTLLTHILGSHEEISGYTEAFLSYQGEFDLFQLRCTTCIDGNFKEGCTYVLDKILHNWLRLSDGIIAHEAIIFVFLIRRPRETLKSIMKMERDVARKKGRLEEGFMKEGTPEAACFYYLSRLEGLSEMAGRFKRLGREPLLIEAEQIVEDTRTVLVQLEAHLHLRNRLEQNYSVFDHTGQYGRGDMSPYIKMRSIQRERSGYPEVELPEYILEQGELGYGRCLRVLKENCRSLP